MTLSVPASRRQFSCAALVLLASCTNNFDVFEGGADAGSDAKHGDASPFGLDASTESGQDGAACPADSSCIGTAGSCARKCHRTANSCQGNCQGSACAACDSQLSTCLTECQNACLACGTCPAVSACAAATQ